MSGVAARALRGAALLWMLAAAACSPSLDWRETQSPEGKFAVVFPGKPKITTREISFGANKIPMTMTAAGKGPTLFAVGVAQLPAAAIGSAEETTAAVNRFRDALLVNARTTVFSLDRPPPALSGEVRSVARSLVSLRAQRHPQTPVKDNDKVVQLAAQIFVVGDRLYQVAALGDADLAENDLQTFFSSFKLLP